MTHTIKKYLTFIWKRTGRNYIYVMWSWRFHKACKIGVSNAPKLRREQVNKSVSEKEGYDVGLTIVSIPILLKAYNTETVLHNAKPFAWYRYHGFRGTDGGSEWFYCFNPFTAILFLCACWYFDTAPQIQWWSVIVFIPFFPIDAILITTLFVLLQWALILGAVWLGWIGLNIIF